MIKYFAKCAPVAQGIERRFPKPCVGCSNHLGGAIYITAKFVGFNRFGGFFILAHPLSLRKDQDIPFSCAPAYLYRCGQIRGGTNLWW